MQSPIRVFAACCVTLLALVAAASTTTASSAHAPGSVAKPALVWSTAIFERSIILLAGADGSRPRLLTDGRGPRISPNGKWVAFARGSDVFVVSTGNGRPWLVARSASLGRWAANSRYIATVASGVLYVTDVHTRSRVTIDRGTAIYGSSFSPSGRDIVWARKRGDNPLVEGGVDLFRARVDGTQSTRLTQDGRSTYPVWGPTRIAFGRVRRTGDVHFPIFELWTMRPQGDGRQRLTRTSHGPIQWDSTGRRLLTSTVNPAGVAASVVDAGNASVRPLIQGPLVLPLALSRNGRSVLAWVRSARTPLLGNLVRVGWDKSQTILAKDVDQLADWNL